MKKLFFSLLVLFLMTGNLLAQIEESGWNGKFGMAVGYSPMWMFTNPGKINEHLFTGTPDLSKKGVYLNGYSGFVYVMLVNNLRVGGWGYNGTTKESSADGNFDRQTVYSINGGGISVEYSLPFNKFALSAGLLLGVGSTNYEFNNSRKNPDWNDFFSDGDVMYDGTGLPSGKISNNYYIVSPTINVDIPVTRFLAFRGGAGYQFTFGSEWKLNGINKISNVPDELNSNAFFVQAGLYIGLFAF